MKISDTQRNLLAHLDRFPAQFPQDTALSDISFLVDNGLIQRVGETADPQRWTIISIFAQTPRGRELYRGDLQEA